MITIEIFRNENQGITEFRANGHANAAEHGKDIICAGVAALTQTAVMGLERYLGRDMELEVASGNLAMRLINSPDHLSNAILETMLLGLKEIANIDPKRVQIKEHRR
ncbi:Hypothetical protein LUCI_3141 [Lucifera butyrica]|uniref:Ribosomal processing cysteine protease Prp n=1 Tax=Lucifera butyrica TaxID=1351585 RepID=A0A498R587_9FIRM|nr:ribosomal-processing cysteine protease Prp [Lucifera butyrica]VBB07876.1 Hypothetical protein LUCI_3141 [Lucifera butyrica]